MLFSRFYDAKTNDASINYSGVDYRGSLHHYTKKTGRLRHYAKRNELTNYCQTTKQTNKLTNYLSILHNYDENYSILAIFTIGSMGDIRKRYHCTIDMMNYAITTEKNDLITHYAMFFR